MSEDDFKRLLNSPARSRLLYRKVGILVLRFVPLVSMHFVVFVCLVRLWYYACRGVVQPSNVGHIAPIDTLFLSLFVVVMLLWLAYLLAASCAQRFCILHRKIITYDVVAYLLIHAGRLIGYGQALPAIMAALAVFGIYLGFCTHVKLYKRHEQRRFN